MREEYITFCKPAPYNLIIQEGPSCFNGRARVEKYKITVEKVEEPIEVIHERLQFLWDYSDNYHDSEPLKEKAKQYGYVFKGDRGNKRK